MKIILVILFFFILSLAVLYGNNYYFSSAKGDDSRTSVEAQNPNTPWKSLDKLNSILKSLQPGDSVLFQRGEVFYGHINLIQGGSDNKPLVFGAYGKGALPIITSLVDLDNWVNAGEGIYESSHSLLGSTVNIVLVDGVLQEMGRFPNSDSENEGYLIFEETDGKNSITDHQLPMSPDWSGGELVIRKSHFTIDRHLIESQEENTLYLSQVAGTYNPVKNFGYFIQNHPETLDRAGEWYYDQQNKKLFIFVGQGPRIPRVQVSSIENLVTNATGVGNVVFDNLHFKGANGTSIQLKGGRNVTVRQCVIEQSGENAFTASDVPKITLQENNISYSLNNGIDLRNNTSDAAIIDNVIECTNIWKGMGKSGVGNGLAIQTSSDNNLIERNKILKTGYIGIRFSGHHTKVNNNYIDEFCLIRDDGAGIYTWTGPANTNYVGREVTGNVVVNGRGAKTGTPSAKIEQAPVEGIYLDDNASGVLVSGNTVAHVEGKGIFIHNARNITIENNLVYDTQYQLFISQDAPGSPVRNNKVSNNIFYSTKSYHKAVAMHSNQRDIDSLVFLTNNYYVAPPDHLGFYRHFTLSDRRYSNSYTLEEWQKEYGKDVGSHKIEVGVSAYSSAATVGVNKYGNGGFNENIDGLYCFSTTKDCDISWDRPAKMEGGTLRVSSKGLSFLILGVGQVEAGKKYMLKFKALADKTSSLDVYLRQSASSYHPISPIETLEIGSGVKEFEIFIPFFIPEANSSIVLESGKEQVTYWIDDISFVEVEAEENASDPSLVKYNSTASSMKIPLQGIYRDVKGNIFRNAITLDPFSSVILLKKSDEE